MPDSGTTWARFSGILTISLWAGFRASALARGALALRRACLEPGIGNILVASKWLEAFVIVSGWGLQKGLCAIVCAWMLAAAPAANLAMMPIQDVDGLAPDGDDGLACTDGMETIPYADDLDAIPVSDAGADAQCLDAPEPVVI